MLYFVKPFGQLTWTANADQTVLDLARTQGEDLGLMTDWWENAERPSNDDDVRVALRYGLAATGGIVVDDRHVVTAQLRSTLRALAAEDGVRTAEFDTTPQVMRVNYYLEQMIPGWKERGLTDDGVAESLKHALRESEEEAAEQLAVPVQPELLRHWERAGGVIPQPV
ncbi:hypothetical protein [Microbacterium jiangjiandongii]|uniref:hypothetical protein n=1 Tax=Microbacterium jiangjiandongii TaxID=3049071 RepID=UPI00214B9955|nr:hypothetical protein [Microbacterium sp. zg.Y843]MCR2816873.1 hypothetical protein [Microbacterium sp. zg.Y843]